MCIHHLGSARRIRCRRRNQRRYTMITAIYTRLQYVPKAMNGRFIIEALCCFLVGEEAWLEEVEGWCGFWLLRHFYIFYERIVVDNYFWRRVMMIITRRRMIDRSTVVGATAARVVCDARLYLTYLRSAGWVRWSWWARMRPAGLFCSYISAEEWRGLPQAGLNNQYQSDQDHYFSITS